MSATPRATTPEAALQQALMAAFGWTAGGPQVAPTRALREPPAPLGIATPTPPAPPVPAALPTRATTSAPAAAPIAYAAPVTSAARVHPTRSRFETPAPQVHIGSIEVEIVSPPRPPRAAGHRTPARAPAAASTPLARDYTGYFGFRQR